MLMPFIVILSTAPGFDELGPKNVTKKREMAVSIQNQPSNNSPKGESLAARNGHASRQGGGLTRSLVGACRAVHFHQENKRNDTPDDPHLKKQRPLCKDLCANKNVAGNNMNIMK